MSLFEYSKWDGSQQFLPQSADKVFDQLAEYLMQHGERVLRNMDELEDEMPEIVELIQKEGLIEKDERGPVAGHAARRPAHPGPRRSTTCSRRFAAIRWAATTPRRKARGPSRSKTPGPTSTATRWPISNLHETIKNAYIRQGGGVPIRLSSEDYVVHETEYQTRCATVVLIDMSGSMNRYGKYYTTKKVALALQAMVRARYPQDSLQMIGFYTFANLMNERQLVNSAPKPVSMFDSRINLRFDLDQPAGPRPPALHQYPRRPAAGAERAHRGSRPRTSRSS